MLMAYTKTQWNENTPITADKLNKIETGVENAIDKTTHIMEIPITHSGGWHQFRWTKPGATEISWTRDISRRKAFEVYNENIGKTLLLLNDDGHLTTTGNMTFENFGTGGGLNANIHNLALHNLTGNGQMLNAGDYGVFVGNPNTRLILESNRTPELSLNGYNHLLYHTGNFNPDTKLDAGNFSISNRDLKIHNKRAMVGFNTADGNYLSINYDRDFGAGVRIHGLTLIESIETGGKLAFSTYGTGGGVNANIHSLTLHGHTGNGQMMTAGENKIYVGNPQTPLILESNTGIIANVAGTHRRILTEGDQCNRFSWTGSRISIDNGGNNARVYFSDISDTSEVARHVHNWHTGKNMRFRADAGLGPLEGEITFTW